MMGRMNRIHGLLFAFLLAAPAVALAVADSASSAIVTVSVDKDLISLLKGTIWAGGIFIAVYAFIGVAFFGFDVRKARATLHDAQKETRERLEELKVDFEALQGLKDKLEQLGAQLEETAEVNLEPATSSGASPHQLLQPTIANSEGRTDMELIREVIRQSTYDWTTIGRVQKRTGLSRDAILEQVRRAPDIQISTGRASKDFIFRLKAAE